MKATERDTQGDRTARLRRRALGTARALLIYALLIGGSVVFSLPFMWMLGTSFKVDREIFSERITLWPMRPVPAPRSPYLDKRYYRAPDDPMYAQVAPTIVEALAAFSLDLPPGTAGGDLAAETLTPGIFRRLRERLASSVWESDAAQLQEVLRTSITQDMVDEVTRQTLRRLSFGPVRIRSLDLQEFDVTAGKPLSDFWTVEGAAGVILVDRPPDEMNGQASDLHYEFPGDRGGVIRMEATVDLSFAADRLHRIQLFMRPDDSWHRVDFFVEKDGKRFRGRRPEHLGDFQWTTVTLQDFVPRGEKYQPDLSKIRLWIPMKEIDADPRYDHGPERARVEMVITRASSLDAWWAKCRRNYRGALNYIPFWRYAATSMFLVILNIVGTVFSCSLVAYAFARLNWPGRDFCFGLMLATLMIPPQVVMIPYFLIVKHLGWYNTLKPLWVLSFFANAFSVFLLRQFMKGIPRDLEDAARIDGCNFMQIYWYVMMPLIKPTLACIAIFTFMGVWNDFMGPLIYLNDQRLYPLSLGLYAFNVQAGNNYGMMMAGSLLMTLPVIMLFFFAQKYFIQGITLTGMKG